MRRWFAVWLFFLAGPSEAVAQGLLDVLVRGGSVYDGSGRPPVVADVGVRGNRIVFIGDAALAGWRATRTIDAAGLVVAPGFIDPHTHVEGDLQSPTTRGLVGYLLQGVTTVVVGNDGGGPVDVGAALRRLAGGAGTNVAYLAGHGSIRQAVMGMANRPPTPTELDSMRSLVTRAMNAGAMGLSTGLYYAPGNFATTEEIIELARVAGSAGGYYDSHIRDESSYSIGLLAAVDETIRIGREASVPVHFAHLKALGVDVWGQSDAVVARILAARAGGLRVTADQYPYDASGTSVGAALLPRWAEGGGRDSLRRRFDDQAVLGRLEKEMTDNLRRRGGADALLVTSGKWQGKRLGAIAAEMKVDPIKAASVIIKDGDASVASFNMNEDDIERLMRQDFVVTGSDGSGGHPRKFGTFPRKIRHYVLHRGVISLARMIEASSAQTAAIVGLPDRGHLAPGQIADLIVFDSASVAERSSYQQPTQLAVGMRYVLVGGRLAVDAGRPTGALAGRPLRRVSTGR